MTTQLNDHGQPANAMINLRRRADRSISEMLGLIKGVLSDGVVSDADAQTLASWIAANPDALMVWPGYELYKRLQKIFADGVIDDDERHDLQQLLKATVGNDSEVETQGNLATSLPLDAPPPLLAFEGKTYLFTGKFVYGTRRLCQAEVANRGGRCADRVTRDVDVLVVGCMGSDDWIHTSFGRKIEAAIRLKREGLPIAIVEERHWLAQLHGC